MIINKEDLKLFRQKQRPFLQNQVDSFKNKITDFVLATDHGYKRGTYFVVICSDCLGVGKIVHVTDYQTNRRQSHC